MVNDLERLKKEFYSLFGRDSHHPLHYFFAPGRVCLIGEHIDYNGGFVMPAAISLGIYGIYRPEENNIIWMRSTLDSKDVVHSLNTDLQYDANRGWGNYPLGVVKSLIDKGMDFHGCETLFHSNLPVGAGLSSSAAVEILTAFMMSEINMPGQFTLQDLALIGKEAENDFVGLQCGIMDQFAVAFGKENHAVMLNCDTLEYEHIPIELGDYELVILNTNVDRQLVDSVFNIRVNECQIAFNILREYVEIKNLADATVEQVLRYIDDEVIRKRALHVSEENSRVKLAAAYLKQGNIEAFGQLLNDSQDSLSQNYEVSGEYLDAMFYTAREVDGCIGAKMSGAGFGGCGFALVDKNRSEDFIKETLKQYHDQTGIQGSAYRVEITDGVRRLSHE